MKFIAVYGHMNISMPIRNNDRGVITKVECDMTCDNCLSNQSLLYLALRKYSCRVGEYMI